MSNICPGKFKEFLCSFILWILCQINYDNRFLGEITLVNDQVEALTLLGGW